MESDASIDARSTYFVPQSGGGAGGKLKVGALRERYVVADELGRGNFATVRRAVRREDIEAGAFNLVQAQQLAIKTIDVSNCPSLREVREGLGCEACVLSSVRVCAFKRACLPCVYL